MRHAGLRVIHAVVFAYVVVSSPHLAKSESTLKTDVLEHCEKATQTFLASSLEERRDLVPYLVEVIKLDLSTKQSSFGAPSVPLPPAMGGVEPIGDNIWRGFNPGRESAAKACAAELLAHLPDLAVTHLGRMLRVAGDMRLSHHARTSIRTAAVTIATNTPLPPEVIGELFALLDDPHYRPDSENLLLLAPLDRVTARWEEALQKRELPPSLLGSASLSLGIDSSNIGDALLRRSASGDAESLLGVLTVLEHQRTPPPQFWSLLKPMLAYHEFLPRAFSLLAESLAHGWKSPCREQAKSEECRGYLAQLAPLILGTIRSEDSALRDTVRTITRFEQGLLPLVRSDAIAFAQNSSHPLASRLLALQVLANEDRPEKNTLTTARALYDRASEDAILRATAFSIIVAAGPLTDKTIALLPSFPIIEEATNYLRNLKLPTPSIRKRFITTALTLASPLYSAAVEATTDHCRDLVPHLRAMPSPVKNGEPRIEFWLSSCGQLAPAVLAKTASQLAERPCSLNNIEQSLMQAAPPGIILSPAALTALSACLADEGSLNALHTALALAPSHRAIRDQLSTMYRTPAVPLTHRLMIFEKRASAGIVDLEPALLLPALTLPAEREQFLAALGGAPSSGDDLVHWLDTLLSDEESSPRMVCLAAAELMRRATTKDDRAQLLTRLLQDDSILPMGRCRELFGEGDILSQWGELLPSLTNPQARTRAYQLLTTLGDGTEPSPPAPPLASLGIIWDDLHADAAELRVAAFAALFAVGPRDSRLAEAFREALHTEIRPALLTMPLTDEVAPFLDELAHADLDRLESVSIAELRAAVKRETDRSSKERGAARLANPR